MPKRCKKCKVPLEGFMYKWIAAKLFGIKPSKKDPELCNKCEDNESGINLEEIEKAKARQENPHLKEYHSKLKELLQTEVASKDNFINWITGLSGGSLLFIFAQHEQLLLLQTGKHVCILSAGCFLFLVIISAILFKIFLGVRYGTLRLEVKLLRILWEGHEIRREAIEEKNAKGAVCSKTEEKLKRNQKESLKVIDPKHKEKTVRWSLIGYYALDIFYWLTMGLFLSGFICMGIWFLSINE